MNLRLDRDGDEDGIVLSACDSAKATRGLFARRPGEQPEEDRGAEFGPNRGFTVETTVWPHTSKIHLFACERPVKEARRSPQRGGGRAPDNRRGNGNSSIALCERQSLLSGGSSGWEGFSVSSYFLRNPLLAEEVVAWTGIGVDKLIRLQSAA
jgi:hypothetical protein